ncbi:MAG: hypothetical protein Q8O13_00050 [Candidatus Omnitrophota bacterium]|nr:hypothetical protein [Candidatus Omnitrophota bacterium]
MLNKRKIFFRTSIISIIIFLFSLSAFAVEIEIRPVLEGKEYYVMKKGEIQTFEAQGFGWDKKTQQKTPNVEIKEIQWSFDARFLELVEMKGNAITLKAIKERTSKLTVTGKIDDKVVTITIFIVIRKK